LRGWLAGSTVQYSTRRTGSVMMSSHAACPFPSCLHKEQANAIASKHQRSLAKKRNV
jgi:hypothetical protein